MTIDEQLRRSTAALAGVSDSPRLDAELLLGHLLGQDRAELLVHARQVVDPSLTERLHRLVSQRRNYMPIPYLIGQQAFCGLTLAVNPAVLIPRPATELLVQAVLERLPSDRPVTIADIGTGSGAIALALAHRLPAARIIATDLSSTALTTAIENARRLGLDGKIDFLRGSLLEPLAGMTLDVIVANLPYLRPDQLLEPSIRSEPSLALDGGQDGVRLITAMLDQAAVRPPRLGLAFELNPDQITVVQRRLANLWPNHQRTIITDGRHGRGLVSWCQDEHQLAVT